MAEYFLDLIHIADVDTSSAPLSYQSYQSPSPATISER